MIDSQQLLRDYCETGSESAFRELVERYVNLVYSTALRLVEGDAHRAQDVGQIVFADLARKASSLSPDVMLGGWLHRHACFTAANVMRGERRRQAREQQAMEMKAMEDTSPDFAQIAPALDEAINALGDQDRAAILLRFFEQHDFRSVAKSLGTNEDAARMRVHRALEKLEGLLKRKGITTTAGALALTVATHAIQAAPAGFASVAATAALAGSTSIATTTTTAITKAIAMTTLQKSTIALTVATALGFSIYEASQVSQLRKQVRVAQQKQSISDEEIQRLRAERDGVQKQLAALQLEMGRGQNQTRELAKLRGEVTRLRVATNGSASRNYAETPTSEAARLWLQRVALLRERFDQWPVKTPELEFLAEQDWLNEVANSDFNTEQHFREAMARLRFTAKTKFAHGIEAALKQFRDASGGRLPHDLFELQSWLQPAMVACLPNYEIAPPGSVKPPQPSSPNSERAETWALVEKGSLKADKSGLADPEYDMHIVIYDGGYYGYGPSREIPKEQLNR